jgi:hypothetical protein
MYLIQHVFSAMQKKKEIRFLNYHLLSKKSQLHFIQNSGQIAISCERILENTPNFKFVRI